MSPTSSGFPTGLPRGDTRRCACSGRESAAPPPDIVVAKDLSSVYEEHHEYLAACSGPPSARLIDVEDGVVSRFIWVGADARIPDGAAPDRTLDVGSTQVEIFEPYGHADLPG